MDYENIKLQYPVFLVIKNQGTQKIFSSACSKKSKQITPFPNPHGQGCGIVWLQPSAQL